jgi:MurNAc alpha-1-phosphate uridylyltransferase
MKVAMILAAGRGERLKPLTDYIPKPLCKVNHIPLIEHHLLNLARAGFERIIINHAYLGGCIRQYLGNGARWGVEIHYSPEPPGGLETGGGIVQALPFLGNNPFITVNADIYTDFDFQQLRQIDSSQLMHLVLVKNNTALSHYGDFGLTTDALVINSKRDYTFAGIAYYHPQIFKNCQYGRYSVTPLIKKYVDEQKVTGSMHQGLWYDIGSLERLKAANTS